LSLLRPPVDEVIDVLLLSNRTFISPTLPDPNSITDGLDHVSSFNFHPLPSMWPEFGPRARDAIVGAG